MRYQLAIFDMDGTILNTIEDLCDSTNAALHENGFPSRSLLEVKSFVGNGIRRLIDLAVPKGTPEEKVEKVFTDFHVYYKTHCAIKTRPYDGIKELLSSLRKEGVLTAVVSNKADYAVQDLCKDYFDGLFDMAVGEREGIKKKPAPDSVYEVLKKLRVEKEHAVYIGDSEVDFMTAQNAQMDLLMVGWGFREEEFLKQCGAKTVLHKPSEIYEAIMN